MAVFKVFTYQLNFLGHCHQSHILAQYYQCFSGLLREVIFPNLWLVISHFFVILLKKHFTWRRTDVNFSAFSVRRLQNLLSSLFLFYSFLLGTLPINGAWFPFWKTFLKSDSHLSKSWFYLLQWKPFKNVERCFYSILKALPGLKMLKFLSWLFWSCTKTARKRLISKFVTS